MANKLVKCSRIQKGPDRGISDQKAYGKGAGIYINNSWNGHRVWGFSVLPECLTKGTTCWGGSQKSGGQITCSVDVSWLPSLATIYSRVEVCHVLHHRKAACLIKWWNNQVNIPLWPHLTNDTLRDWGAIQMDVVYAFNHYHNMMLLFSIDRILI